MNKIVHISLQTVAEAGGIVAENTDFTFSFSFYKEDVADKRTATLSFDEKVQLI